MTFDLKIKFDGKTITRAKANKLDAFDLVLDGLKEKFGEKRKVKTE